MKRRLLCFALCYCLFATFLVLFPPHLDGTHRLFSSVSMTPAQAWKLYDAGIILHQTAIRISREGNQVALGMLGLELALGLLVTCSVLLFTLSWPSIASAASSLRSHLSAAARWLRAPHGITYDRWIEEQRRIGTTAAGPQRRARGAVRRWWFQAFSPETNGGRETMEKAANEKAERRLNKKVGELNAGGNVRVLLDAEDNLPLQVANEVFRKAAASKAEPTETDGPHYEKLSPAQRDQLVASFLKRQKQQPAETFQVPQAPEPAAKPENGAAESKAEATEAGGPCYDKHSRAQQEISLQESEKLKTDTFRIPQSCKPAVCPDQGAATGTRESRIVRSRVPWIQVLFLFSVPFLVILGWWLLTRTIYSGTIEFPSGGSRDISFSPFAVVIAVSFLSLLAGWAIRPIRDYAGYVLHGGWVLCMIVAWLTSVVYMLTFGTILYLVIGIVLGIVTVIPIAAIIALIHGNYPEFTVIVLRAVFATIFFCSAFAFTRGRESSKTPPITDEGEKAMQELNPLPERATAIAQAAAEAIRKSGQKKDYEVPF